MNELKRAIDTDLSGLRATAADRAMILDRAWEERKVTKKRSTALVLALALILAATVAAAGVLISNQYFADVAQLESENGYYGDWSLEKKLMLLGLMKQYDVAMDRTEADALLSGEGISAAEREARVDALITARYGMEGRTDIITLARVLEKELGEWDAWTMEQKVWYSQLLADTGLLGSDEAIFRMPGEDAVEPDAAMAIARAEILRVWGLTDADLADYEVSWVYSESSGDAANPHYEIYFKRAGAQASRYDCAVGRDGRILSTADGFGWLSPAEEKARQSSEPFEKELYRMMCAYANAHGIAEGMLHGFPVEHKAPCLEEIRPTILAYLATNPAYVEAATRLMAVRRYGVPDEHAISQAEAAAIAEEALAEYLGVPGDLLTDIPIRNDCVTYLVDEPAAPLWKLKLVLGSSEAYWAAYPNQNGIWMVTVNAYTGEVADVWEHTVDWNHPDQDLAELIY